MSRKMLINFWLLVITMTILSLLIIGTSPLWLTVSLIYPSIVDPVQEFVMTRITRTMTQFMFRAPMMGKAATKR
jgi:hypothetical protein